MCYLISGSERSSTKIRMLAADELRENGEKYEFIPNEVLVDIEQETRALAYNNWGGEYQLIALSGKLHIPIYVFNRTLDVPQWFKIQTDMWPEFNQIQVS